MKRWIFYKHIKVEFCLSLSQFMARKIVGRGDSLCSKQDVVSEVKLCENIVLDINCSRSSRFHCFAHIMWYQYYENEIP